MERTLTHNDVLARPSFLHRIWPLWRFAVAAFALFALLATTVWIGLDVQQIRKDLDSTSSAIIEAEVLRDRLRMETESRRRTLAMEKAARQLHLSDEAQLVEGVTP